MVKPEWGAKRTCPKCGVRFYDLGQEEPITCIACGINWNPEPVLKSKQPMPFEAAAKPQVEAEKEDEDLATPDPDLELEVDEDAEQNPDDEVDLPGGDDDLGEIAATGEDEET